MHSLEHINPLEVIIRFIFSVELLLWLLLINYSRVPLTFGTLSNLFFFWGEFMKFQYFLLFWLLAPNRPKIQNVLGFQKSIFSPWLAASAKSSNSRSLYFQTLHALHHGKVSSSVSKLQKYNNIVKRFQIVYFLHNML